MMRVSIPYITRNQTPSGLARKCAQQQRLLSTESLAVAEEAADTNFVSSYQHVLRHGPGDGVITLNVGGKEFKTLQSTIQESTVLCQTVARAQANGEVLDQQIIFVDRDPTHFPLILTYLRNKTEGIAYNNKTMRKTVMGVPSIKLKKMAKRPQYVRLPQDQGQLQDLYVEAVHYNLTELQDQLCHTSFMVTVMSWFGGGNPFQQANEALKTVRRSLLAVAGTSGIFAAMQSEVDWLQEKLKGFLGQKGDDGKSGGGATPSLA
ncbi:BTB/POZ domain containing protein [Nitzschia inconspicua]|uniref:BTB/POZ domain containing protein n=1 Tax=Nitzschia inconspicua TaxID=303405 RepID=A0A9K3KGX3_9STRA|nr:BTB/POZ domain containing protein [Nitzschia inconspicua]